MSDPLILASTSPYRAALLDRLGLPFSQHAPDFEELRPGSAPPQELVLQNSLGKARSILAMHPDATVIGSDQLAVCDELVLGKPGTKARACEQLAMLSGRTVSFLTALCLIDRHRERSDVVRFDVCFRQLSRQEIETYVAIEEPIDCAGSFKSEGLGIALFERMEGDDPTVLIGLPLIRLSE